MWQQGAVQISIGQVSEPLWDCRYLSMGKKNKGKQKAKKKKMTEALKSGGQNPKSGGVRTGPGKYLSLRISKNPACRIIAYLQAAFTSAAVCFFFCLSGCLG